MGLKKPPTINEILKKIRFVRNQHVILDSDLSNLIGVATKELNEKVKNNPDWLPGQSYFQLSDEEVNDLMPENKTFKKNKNEVRIAYLLEGAQKAAMLFQTEASLNLLTSIARIMAPDAMIFDYGNASYDQLRDHCKILSISQAANKSAFDWGHGQRVTSQEFYKHILVQQMKEKKDEALKGGEILIMIFHFISMGIPCPTWLLAKFAEKLFPVLYGKVTNFGAPESFGSFCHGKIERIREATGLNDLVKYITNLIIDADKKLAKDQGIDTSLKTGKTQLKPKKLKKDGKPRKKRSVKTLVFDIMEDPYQLIMTLHKLKAMTELEILQFMPSLMAISNLKSDTLYYIYYEEVRRLKKTF